VRAIVGGIKFIIVAYLLQYPVLSPGRDEFVYESCTPLPKGPGFLDGSLTFVPGRYALISIEVPIDVAILFRNFADAVFCPSCCWRCLYYIG
jgi:hypothetical protein